MEFSYAYKTGRETKQNKLAEPVKLLLGGYEVTIKHSANATGKVVFTRS